MALLDALWAFLELVGGALHVIDSKAHPATLRRRWPTIVIVWLVVAAAVVFGTSLVREFPPGHPSRFVGWLWVVGAGGFGALVTHRWRSLAWPSERGGDR